MAQDSVVDVTIHMLISLDGKTNGRLYECPHFEELTKEYYRIDQEHFLPQSPVRLMGRGCFDTLVKFESPEKFPPAQNPGDRSDFHADLAAHPVDAQQHRYLCVVDPHGRLAFTQNTFESAELPYYNGDRFVEILVEDFVGDNFLAYLRQINVPYIFAGKSELNLKVALQKLSTLFHTSKVVCHGGSILNGTLQEQGLVSHLSLLYAPVVSGRTTDAPLFRSLAKETVPMSIYDRDASEKVAHNGVWLRFTQKK